MAAKVSPDFATEKMLYFMRHARYWIAATVTRFPQPSAAKRFCLSLASTALSRAFAACNQLPKADAERYRRQIIRIRNYVNHDLKAISS